MSEGIVYLLGAGPGGVKYLTLQAHSILQQADALVYDALVDEALLGVIPAGCDRHCVGKRGGQPSTPQPQINQLLVTLAQQHRHVVRLKSGDPFIFGRCAAEIEALRQAGCAYEVVPGLSSALAGPLLAHIPLTDPVLSAGFTVVSAHQPDQLNWEALSALDTLVFLMGTRQLPAIVEQLQRHGRSPRTPIAIIRWAGQPQQQIWLGTLENIVQKTSRQRLSPAIMVIGEVVKLRDYLQPPTPARMLFPLQGKTVLVTRSAGQSAEFRDRLEAEGARVVEMPALEITAPDHWQPLDDAISQLSGFDWLVLTSANGVDFLFERLQHHGLDARALAGVKIAVVGRKTATVLRSRQLTPDFVPPEFVADSLAEHFPGGANLAGTRILFPRVQAGGREALVNGLAAKGADVVEVPAYQSRCPQAIAPEAEVALRHREVDVVTFASSKTVRCFQRLAAAKGLMGALEGVCIASIGPQTSATCREHLGHMDVEAQEYTLEGLTEAVIACLTGQ
ncbi:MAG: uroporphyrinogen-III C-methyltransferase [Elainellaceae cyanobacterium]